jgi:hypothetical protein
MMNYEPKHSLSQIDLLMPSILYEKNEVVLPGRKSVPIGG